MGRGLSEHCQRSQVVCLSSPAVAVLDQRPSGKRCTKSVYVCYPKLNAYHQTPFRYPPFRNKTQSPSRGIKPL